MPDFVRQHPSPNFDDRGKFANIDMLVMHYTGMESADLALTRLCDKESRVSAHYFIDEDGSVRQLVDESQRAWHAGVASWRGQHNINQRSIGIELVNPGHEFGYRPFTAAQIEVVISLSQDILKRHPIPPRNVVGHSDIAPSRKNDPGELFDWQRLAAAGIGLWPGESGVLEMDRHLVAGNLATVGYEIDNLSKAVRAFQRHFRPARVTGRIDAGTARCLSSLVNLLGDEA